MERASRKRHSSARSLQLVKDTDRAPLLTSGVVHGDGVPDAAATKDEPRATLLSDFDDGFEFYDDVHGSIKVSRLERDAIDSPEFRRLFRLGQLGFVDFVFPTANHTRGVHCIGACHIAKRLVKHLNENNKECAERPKISHAERVLIGLGALLHDIPHGPFSHDIEKKSHQLYLAGPTAEATKFRSHYGIADKHDDFESNPALYVALMNPERSILARVLRYYSRSFVQLLESDAAQHPHLARFVDLAKESWKDRHDEMLPSLVFHLLVYEKEKEAKDATRKFRTTFDSDDTIEWGLGPASAHQALHEAWYQPYRHDIIGDTLSADLIDYILRDQSRLGMKNVLDMKLLNYYVLVPSKTIEGAFRCALDLNDHKRGTFRAERLNDIFRLLDIRHQIHEKAVAHRVVQAAIAMLSRIGLILGPKKPTLAEMYGAHATTNSLSGDSEFLRMLVETSEQMEHDGGHNLAVKLAERRVYRPLVVMPGDRIPILLKSMGMLGNAESTDFRNEETLREFAAILDSTYFSRFFLLISSAIEGLLQHAFADKNDLHNRLSTLAKDTEALKRAASRISKRVIFWTTPYKQLYKDPAILVCADNGVIDTIDNLGKKEDAGISHDLQKRITAGIKDAETKNEGLWKMYVFLSDGLFYTGALAKVLRDHVCGDDYKNHEKHLRDAQDIVVRALHTAWEYWSRKMSPAAVGRLTEAMDEQTLSALLEYFLKSEIMEGDCPISSVKLDLYLHDTERECRDVRYKFAQNLDSNAVITTMAGSDKQRKQRLREIYKWLEVEEGYLSGEELVDVLTQLENAGEVFALGAMKAARTGNEDEAIQALWRPF